MGILESSSYQADLDRALAQVAGLERLEGTTVLVAGATGLIGSFVVDMLSRHAAAGHDMRVVAVGRSLERLQARFGDAPGVTCAAHDVSEPWDALPAADYVVHAASKGDPASFAADPVGIMRANLDGTYAALEHVRAHGGKLCYVSSGEVYGEFDHVIEELEEPMAGAGTFDLLAPRSCYPLSKRAAETLCASHAAQFGTSFVVVRPSHTFGPNALASDSRANARFVRDALAGHDIVLRSAGTQVRSYTYVADGASGLLSALLAREEGQAYNVAWTPARCSIAEFAAEVAHQAGVGITVGEDPNPGSPISRQVLSSAKLEALGWQGSYDVPAGIAATLAAMREADC